MAISRIAAFAHAGNPTTAPTGTLPGTAAGDVVVVFVTNGGSNSDPPALGGTSVTTGGLTWAKRVASGLAVLSGTLNGSLWWARATGNHARQTVVATTVGSGALVGAVYRGCKSSGDPFNASDFQTNYHYDGPTWYGWNSGLPLDVTVDECMLLWGFCSDAAVTYFDTYTSYFSPVAYFGTGDSGEQPVVVQAASTGGPGTAAGFYEFELPTADLVYQADGDCSSTTQMNLAIVAALEPGAPPPIPNLLIPRRADRGLIIR